MIALRRLYLNNFAPLGVSSNIFAFSWAYGFSLKDGSVSGLRLIKIRDAKNLKMVFYNSGFILRLFSFLGWMFWLRTLFRFDP